LAASHFPPAYCPAAGRHPIPHLTASAALRPMPPPLFSGVLPPGSDAKPSTVLFNVTLRQTNTSPHSFDYRFGRGSVRNPTRSTIAVAGLSRIASSRPPLRIRQRSTHFSRATAGARQPLYGSSPWKGLSDVFTAPGVGPSVHFARPSWFFKREREPTAPQFKAKLIAAVIRVPPRGRCPPSPLSFSLTNTRARGRVL